MIKSQQRGGNAKRRSTSTRILSAAVLATPAMLAWAAPASGAGLYWDMNGTTAGAGTTPDGTWSASDTNWNDDSTGGAGGTIGTWASGFTALFAAGSDASGPFTVTVSGTQDSSSLVFEEGNATLTGGQINLSGATPDIQVASGLTTTIQSVISGSGGLTKLDSGTLVLSGANIYAGTTSVNIGTLVLGASNVLPDTEALAVNSTGTLNIGANSDTVGAVTLTAGTISGTTGVLTGSSYDVRNGTISAILGGTGALTKTTTSTVTLSGANTYSGGTTLTAGTLSISADNNLGGAGGITVNGNSTLLIGGSFSTARTVALSSAAGTINVSGANNVTMSGVISGTGSIVKAGTGTLKLTGTNTHVPTSNTVASVTVNAGVLEFGVEANLGGVPGAADAAAITINGGTLRCVNATTFTLNVNRGVTIGNSGGTIEVTSTANTGLSLPASASFTLNGGASAVLTKTGPGRFTMNTTSDSYLGKYKVLAGTLNVPGDGRWGKIPTSVVDNYFFLDGGALRDGITSGSSWDSNRGITLGAGGGTIMQPGAGTTTDTLTYNGIIKGTLGGALNIAATGPEGGGSSDGIVILGGASTYDGITTIAAGMTLRVGAAGTIPDTSLVTLLGAGAVFDLNNLSETVKSISGTAGTVAVGSGTVTVDNPAGETYSSVFTASAGGKVVKNGTGVWILKGSSTGFAGGEIVLNAGTLGIGANNCLGSNVTNPIFTINGGKISNDSSTGRTIPATVNVNIAGDFTADDSLSATQGQILFNGGTVTLKNGNRTVTVSGTANLRFDGPVGEDAAGRGLIKAGAGILVLNSATNAYTGDTTILGGTLQVDGDGKLGSGVGALHLSGGKLNTSATRTASSDPIPNPIDLTADTAITTTSAAAIVDLNLSSNTVGGSGGTLTFRNDGGAGAGVFQPRFSGAGFNFAQPIVIANGAVGTTLLQSFNVIGTSQTFSGVISGTGSFKRTGTANNGGDTILTAANTYSGGTTLIDGGIGLGVDSVGAVTSGPVGTGTLAVNPSPTGTNARLFAVGGPRTLANPITFVTSPLLITGTNNLTLSGNVDLGSAGRTIQVDSSGATLLSGVVSGSASLTKSGAGVLAMTGANTYSAGTNVSAGKLSVSPAAIPANDVVVVNGGEYEMGQGGGVYKPGSLAVNAGGKASIAVNGSSALDMASANFTIAGATDAWTAQMDLKNNDAILRSTDVNRVGDVARITNQLKQGLNATVNNNQALFWTGQGVVTSSGWQGGTNYTAIGLTYNDKAAAGLPAGALYTTFDGQTVGVNDVLVKYTWFGDADLDGAVTSNDYFQIDTGFLGSKTGWINGDFDYSGSINSSDYFLIDSAFLAQAGVVLAPDFGELSRAAGAQLPAGVTAVPEPASLGVIALAGAGLLLRRRRR